MKRITDVEDAHVLANMENEIRWVQRKFQNLLARPHLTPELIQFRDWLAAHRESLETGYMDLVEMYTTRQDD